MQLLYQAGQVGKTMARKPEGVYTDQGVFVPFSAVQLQTTFASDLDDVSNFGAAGTHFGAFNYIDPGAGPFGGGALYFQDGIATPYQDYALFDRTGQPGLDGALEFTIDAWIKPESGRAAASRGIVGICSSTMSGAAGQYMLYTAGTSGTRVGLGFQIHRGTGAQVFTSTVSSTTSSCLVDQWNHIRVSVCVNSSSGLNELRWFVNGVYQTSIATGRLATYTVVPTIPHQIGIYFKGTASNTRFPGWIGPIRVIKGYALHRTHTTGVNFIPPTTYFPVY
jgi:hypothetical protein